MTDHPAALHELNEVLALLDKATPGRWSQDTGGDITRDDGTCLFVREPVDGNDAESFANADAVEAAINFLRTHGAEIARRVGGDDFVLVPREPTPEMLRAGGCVMPPDAPGQDYIGHAGALQCWQLMLNAAPPAPSEVPHD